MKKMNLQNVVGAYFIKIYSDDKGEVAYAIRMGANFPCQSAASDMTLFETSLVKVQLQI